MANVAHISVEAPQLGLRKLFVELQKRFKTHHVYRATYNALRELSDRELADLSLSRSMIKRVALEAAYGRNI